jgi:hypothetical protein
MDGLMIHGRLSAVSSIGHWFLFKSATITPKIINQRPDPVDAVDALTSEPLNKPIYND